MKLKHRFTDFRVTELLEDDYLAEGGPFTIYRVTKRKLSTPDAVRELAELTGVEVSDVGLAGLKDRQGITTQHMSVPRRGRARLDRREIKIEHAGFAQRALDSKDSRGNAFHITVRAVDKRELAILRRNMKTVRAHGLPNYFDDQRFGNLRHGQGWIARDLMQGRSEEALRNLLAARSPFDDDRNQAFKSAVWKRWGDWRGCRDAAGRYGHHHSVFEHLAKRPDDFAGAFRHVSRRMRLIHLYAYQSHLWNRAVAARLREILPARGRVVIESTEGPLVCFEDAPPAELGATVRLPGPGLEDVSDPALLAAMTGFLASEGLSPESFRIDGVSGFQLKGEDRRAVVRPEHLRVRPATDDPDHPGLFSVVLRFELPRGAYASLVVRRLFARSYEKRAEYEQYRDERAGKARRAPGGRSESASGRGSERGSGRSGGGQGGRGSRSTGHGSERSSGHGSGRGGGYSGRGSNRDSGGGRPHSDRARKGPDRAKDNR